MVGGQYIYGEIQNIKRNHFKFHQIIVKKTAEIIGFVAIYLTFKIVSHPSFVNIFYPKRQNFRQIMNVLARKGKFNTYRIFASVLLVSIYTIVSYNLVMENIESKKLIQQIIRFCLTVLIMFFIFKGQKWAVILFTVLFSIGTLIGLFSLFGSMTFLAKTPILVMTIVYGLAIYHLNFSKSFKEYFIYLQYRQ